VGALPELRPVSEELRSKVRIFSSASEAERARRPTDGVLLGSGAVLLVLGSIAGTAAQELEGGIAALVNSLPVVLDGLWTLAYDVPIVWAGALLVIALVARGRKALLRDQLLALVIAGALGALLHRGVEGSWPSVDWTFATGPPALVPSARLALAAAVLVTSAPHLSRPLRYVGRWVLTFGAFGSVFTAVSTPGGTAAAVLIGAMAAATVHLVFGSPGGRPSLTEVALSMRDLGVTAARLRPAELQPAGVWTVEGEDDGGRHLLVRVFGRDAWDGQLVTSTWRFLWYRRSSARLRLSRERQVEHEALLLLLARQAGVAVPGVRAAGRARSGDALLVLEPVAAPARGEVEALWSALATAHRAGLSPGAITDTDIGWAPSGAGLLSRWAEGSTAPDEQQRLQDRAQLLIASAIVVGRDEAIRGVVEALGHDGAAELVPWLQVSTVPAIMRRQADDLDEQVERLRQELADHLGLEEPELVQLRRITVGTIVQAALLVMVGVMMIAGLSGMDFAAAAEEFRDLQWGAVVVCLVLAQIARASGCISTIGASPTPLPLGPVLQLQFALAYINMAVPSTVGRLATMIRFFQRVGGSAATAVGVGALDSMANFVVQIGLIVTILGLGLGNLDPDLTAHLSDLDINVDLALLVLVLLVVAAAAVVLAVPRFREHVLPTLHQVRDGVRTLKSPKKLAMVLGGNALGQLLYGATLSAAAAATGNHVDIADSVLINNLVSLFAGLLPVPGGIGVSEAGLTAGLVAVGVPEPAALAAALLHRLLTVYVPPVWGYFSLQYLRRERYL
jgi:uncharacterized membrane protein YbhN (UPF0104 family)